MCGTFLAERLTDGKQVLLEKNKKKQGGAI
jgi:hypothetical protein